MRVPRTPAANQALHLGVSDLYACGGSLMKYTSRVIHLLVLLAACGVSGPRLETTATELASRPPNPTCIAPSRPASRVGIVRAYPALRFDQPVALVPSPDHAWWFIAERKGRIWRVSARDESAPAELVLDISARVSSATGAIGLLALALHPQFATNGVLFVSYTATGRAPIMSRLSRFVSRDGGRTFDRSNEQRLLELDQLADYHVNTDLEFGPDGYLYVGFGDGGPQGDPLGRAQDRFTLKGKILRLDVDTRPGERRRYRIPPDNPYARGGGAPEVWARGLRNPWRFSFDRVTGELWAGDVGGDLIEEIDLIVAGGNYGWNIREGTRCMIPGACADHQTIDPVVELPHPQVSSITFGVAYRGSAIPELVGHLIYADYSSGVIWEVDPTATPPVPRMLADSHTVVAFAEDAAGEPWIVDYAGTLWRIVPGTEGPPDLPALLSETGCFKGGGVPVDALVPYDVNVGFWSDSATKRRWLAIPDGSAIAITPAGQLELPIGSVVAKEFSDNDIRLETRLLVRHSDGNWAGYTYQWDATQIDALLVPAQAAGTYIKQPRTWYLPHRGECSRCHQATGGYTIGLELAQLDRRIETKAGSFDQLAELGRIGLLAGKPHTSHKLTGSSSEQRARGWLHANCAYCHQPGATGQGDMDLRASVPVEAMNICDVAPQFGSYGVDNARRVAPGDPSRSILLRRIRSRGYIRMPPLGTTTVDVEGTGYVENWIKQLTCSKPSR